jgi:4-amino-4-deoxy-L-arabinose transferase-like glycosyltransferase
VLFLAWCRRLCLVLDRRLIGGVLAFTLVVAPWYAWVGAETKASFLSGFIRKHNVGRYLSPMENHSGPIYYYPAVLLLGFAPWSVFLALSAWYAVRSTASVRSARLQAIESSKDRPPEGGHCERTDAYRFLTCWAAVYVVFFSLAGTKLPNYILPIYPAVAVATAAFLDRWRRGAARPPAWVLKLSLACLALAGIATATGLLLASGTIEVPFIRGPRYPGLAVWAVLGAVPVLGAAAAWWCFRREQRDRLVGIVAVTAVLFVGLLAGGGSTALEAYKAPRDLTRAYQARQAQQDIRVACYKYFQPSLVFYCRRQVDSLEHEHQALEFLRCPLEVYLFVPAPVWRELEAKVPHPYRLVDRRRDLYSNSEVVVITNAE